MNEPLKNRMPTHGVKFIGGQPTVVFDTICTRQKKPWLANDGVHLILVETWKMAQHWLVGRYVVMPDHIHLFAWATEDSDDYEKWIRFWKSRVSKKHGRPDDRWQDNHWDRRMRNEEAYEKKWNYIRDNPVRSGLVNHPDDWPYWGEIHELRW